MSLPFRDYLFFHPKERTSLVFLFLINCILFLAREWKDYYGAHLKEDAFISALHSPRSALPESEESAIGQVKEVFSQNRPEGNMKVQALESNSKNDLVS